MRRIRRLSQTTTMQHAAAHRWLNPSAITHWTLPGNPCLRTHAMLTLQAREYQKPF